MAFLLWRLPAGGALCSPSREVGEVGPLCSALGLRSNAAALARTSRRLSRPLAACLGCGCPWHHGNALRPPAALLVLDHDLRRTWGLVGPRVLGRAPPEGPEGIGGLLPPSSSLGTSPPKQEPCNPLQRLWGGPSPSLPRAMGKGTRMAAIKNLQNDQHLPRFFLQDLLVWSIKR